MEFNAIGRILLSENCESRQNPHRLVKQSQSNHILLVQTGIGPERARLITQRIIEWEPWDLVISSGFAGALKAVPVGSVVIGHEVIIGRLEGKAFDPEPQRIICHADWVKISSNIAPLNGNPIQEGQFVTMDRVLTQAIQKQRLGNQTGAVAVDMESGAIGHVAEEHQIPFLIIRAISDGVNEDMPVDFNEFLKPYPWAGGVKTLLASPWSWKGLWQLYRNSRRASEQLSLFFDNFFKSIPVDNPPPVAMNSRT